MSLEREYPEVAMRVHVYDAGGKRTEQVVTSHVWNVCVNECLVGEYSLILRFGADGTVYAPRCEIAALMPRIPVVDKWAGQPIPFEDGDVPRSDGDFIGHDVDGFGV
jgi:hypothetical protein